MERVSVDYFTNKVEPGSKGKRSGFHSYISEHIEKNARDSHARMVYLFKNC